MILSLRTVRLSLDATEELSLFFGGLEASVTHLGGGVDELESDFFEGVSGSLRQQGLSQGDDSLLGTHDGALQHDEVFVDLTVVWETTHRSDRLFGQVVGSGTVEWVLSQALTHTVDLLVDLSSVVVTVLTGTWHLELHTSWVPRTDTSDLSQTSVGLTWKSGDTPTSDHTVGTSTLGHR